MLTEEIFDYIGSCRDEKCISEGLAIYFKNLGRVDREVEQHFDGLKFKIDIVVNGEIAIEVKYQAMVHDGLGQALCYRLLLGYKESILIHTYEYLTTGIIRALSQLSRNLPIRIVAIGLRKREIYEF